MADVKQDKSFDTFRIGEKTYMKDLYLGPKAWGKIQLERPGRFVDILEAKFSQIEAAEKRVNINR